MNEHDLQEKMLEGRKSAKKLKNLLSIPSPLKAIRDMCKKCVGSASEVKICHIEGCPLWVYRFGRSPKEADLQVPEIDQYGNVIDHHDFTGYRD